MKVSAAAWEGIGSDLRDLARAGIAAQRALADEFDRRAQGATEKRCGKLSRMAAEAREVAEKHEADLASILSPTPSRG